MESKIGAQPSVVLSDVLHSLTPQEKSTLGYVCAHDFRAFIATCLFEQFTYPFCPFHDFVADLVQKNLCGGLRYVVAAPRGWGKSSILTEAATLWLMLRREYVSFSSPKDPRDKRYILIVSDTTDQAMERLSAIKFQLEANDIIRELFPRASQPGLVWKSDVIANNFGVMVRALGTGSKIRGRRFGASRPDLVFCDDIENLEQVNSESIRTFLYEWFTRDLLKAVDRERGDVVVVGTVLSRKALLYRLLNDPEFAAWDGRVFKAILRWPERMDLWDQFGEILKDRTNPSHREQALEFYNTHREEMDRGAEVLWPQRFSIIDMMTIYYLEGKRSFLFEYQNEIQEDVEKIFDLNAYQYYTEEELENIPTNRLLFYMYVDPATGKRKGVSRKKSTDMFACVVIAKDILTNVYYVVDYYADIIPPQRQFQVIKKFLEKYPIYRFYVEANTSQYFYYQSLRDWLFQQQIYRPFPRQDINKEAKERRIESLAPYLENWTLRLNPRHRQLLMDLENYPAIEYDDLLDCLSSCFFKAYRSFRPVFA